MSRPSTRPDVCVECGCGLVSGSTPAGDCPPGTKQYGGRGMCRGCLRRNQPEPTGDGARRTARIPVRRRRAATEDDMDRGWMVRAACRDQDPALWFPLERPGRRGANAPADSAYRAARAICDGCPVKDACLADALALSDFNGMRGGHTPKQLRRLAREDS